MIFRNYFFPHQHSSSSNPRLPHWPRIVLATYSAIGLFTFGHNYVNYPVKDKVYIDIVQRYEDRYDEEGTIGNKEEKTTSVIKSGIKATLAGALWPAYVMILINEEIAS